MTNKEVESSDGVLINYSTYGKGFDLVLFVHCWAGNQSYWRNQLDFFKEDLRVVTIDLAGHGKSGLGRDKWTISGFGDDIMAVLNELDFHNVYLVGHSMGGLAALDAASKLDRITKLFLIDILTEIYWPIPEDEVQGFVQPFRENFSEHTYQWVKNALFVSGSDNKVVNWVAGDMAKASPHMAIESLENMLSGNFDEPLESVRQRKAPVYLFNSDMQQTDAQSLTELGFYIEIIRGTGHFPMLETPQEFNRRLFGLIAD